jgi:hypothetical protein
VYKYVEYFRTKVGHEVKAIWDGEKTFTSSSNIYAEAYCRKGVVGAGRATPSSLSSMDISFEDDVTVILFLGVCFLLWTAVSMSKSPAMGPLYPGYLNRFPN